MIESVCGASCCSSELQFPFPFPWPRTAPLVAGVFTIRICLQGVALVLNGLLSSVFLPCDSVNHYNLVMKAGSVGPKNYLQGGCFSNVLHSECVLNIQSASETPDDQAGPEDVIASAELLFFPPALVLPVIILLF